MKEYAPMTYLDFTNPEIAGNQKKALDQVRASFGKEYSNIINGKDVITEKKTISVNPANPAEQVGIFQKGGKDHAEEAMQSALKAFETWKKVPVERRAQYLFDAAEEIRNRRYEINAWMISEVGKSYIEADADTCEAIDFLEYYGRQAIRYGADQECVQVAGENNIYRYIPLGVGVIIPPWNFPFAIMIGTSVAAIATGNTVVLKPSSDAPMMARLFADIMKKVGLPDGVLNYFVASGAEAGDYLVQHPKTRFISFTGSMEVGLRINELAAKMSPGQIWIKRVVAEMGGKDTIVVDSEADVDAAVQGVLVSAYGFQGQKCSACSRAIVDEKVYDEFVAKLKTSVAAIKQGDPYENFYMGPVVSDRAEQTILKYIEIAKKENTLLIGGNKLDRPGYFIAPTVFIDVKPFDTISQEEIFGPVLAVIKSKNFEDSMTIANNTKYGLTGAIFSKNPDKLKVAEEDFMVGNLYINRKCTGALVGVQPFGGFNMSGTDSKAGSKDYLGLFMQGKSIAVKPL